MACADDVDPDRILLTVRGVAGGSAREVDRVFRTSIRLSPIYGGLDTAIFADQDLSLTNQLNVQDDLAIDADIYTNGNFTSDNNVTVEGGVYAQGNIAISNSGTFQGGVWANGSVAVSNNAVIGADATSSTSSITLLNAAHVNGNATAATTINAGANAIDGVITPGSPQGPPPERSMPQITWDAGVQAAWQDADYAVHTYTDCAAAKAFIDSGPTGSNLVRIAATCSLDWANNSDIPVRGDLAIITDGSISTTNNTTFTAEGGEFTMYLIVPYPSAGVPTCTTGSIAISNLTQLEGLTTFVYSPCTINFGNNNSTGWEGQLIGGTVNITNHMTLQFSPVSVPGSEITGFAPAIEYTEEISSPA